MAVKHRAMMSFDEVAAALRPLDRPEALIKGVSDLNRTFAVGLDTDISQDAQAGYELEEPDHASWEDEEEEELDEDDDWLFFDQNKE